MSEIKNTAINNLDLRILTGITSSGTPHIGNYIGAIKPAIESQHSGQAIYFIADLHSLVKLWDPILRKKYVLEIAATWLALGLDISKALFYKQSDIPEISELAWILMTVASKGLLNRAHAYKSLVAENLNTPDLNNPDLKNLDPDHGITMGLFNYPVLMAADILIFNAHQVPVGKDQIQHIEIARDIAARFNFLYKKEIFVLPEARIDEALMVLPGLDGRKMSKSYGNTIPLFEAPEKIQKLINKIKTNSQEPHEPKEIKDCVLFNIYKAFGDAQEIKNLENAYAQGIGWGEVKKILAEKIAFDLKEPREKYLALMANPSLIESYLKQGAERARKIARENLYRIKDACGLLN